MIAPRALRAQQEAVPVIGFLSSVWPGPVALFVAAFRQGTSETGYIEGQSVAIEYRWAEGRFDPLPVLAAYLVGRKVDLIVASGGVPSVLAAKSATLTIPDIVHPQSATRRSVASSPVLPRPGGNVTGFSIIPGTS